MNKVSNCGEVISEDDPLGTIYKGNITGQHYIKYKDGFIVLESGHYSKTNNATTKLLKGQCIKLEVNL